MRLKGMGNATIELRPKKTVDQPKRSGPKTKICPSTGRTLIDRGWYDEMVPPPIPPKTEGYGETVESILAHAHYLVARGWNDPNSPTACTLASETYGMAIHAGWHGHMSQWADNVLAGSLRHGTVGLERPEIHELPLEVDRTPRKIKAKLGES